MDPARFTRVDATTWRIEPRGAMRVPAIIYADEEEIDESGPWPKCARRGHRDTDRA